MKKYLGLTLAVLLLCAACSPALAASMPAKAKTAIVEAGLEGYKAITTITYGRSSPPSLVFTLLRKGDQNLLCALMFDSEAQAYELLAANEHLLPNGKITPKLSYKAELEYQNEPGPLQLHIDFSISKPALGQPSRVSLAFSPNTANNFFFLDSAEITYPADKDGIAVRDVLSGFGTDMVFFTRLKVDKRGDVKATSGSHTLQRGPELSSAFFQPRASTAGYRACHHQDQQYPAGA